MMKRGWSLSALLLFVIESAAESREDMRRRRPEVRAMIAFSVGFALLTVVSGVFALGTAVISFAAATVVGVVAFTAWACSAVALLRTADGAPRPGVGLANYLTLARFYLIAPVVILFHDGFYTAALTVYVVLGLTDVADGIVARVRREQTEFGVMFDPLADVFSTAALFTMFFVDGLVPAWLYILLMARYIMLFLGTFLLFLFTGPMRIRATVPGKIVGLVQGTAVCIVIVCALSGGEWLERVAPVLFPILGVGFASIIVSQFVIGLRHVRARKAVGVEV